MAETGTGITIEQVQEAHTKAFWTSTPIAGFKHDNVRKYRHEAKALLAGQVGLTVAEQQDRMKAAIDTLVEAIAYSDGRDFAAHQVAKAAARETYEAVMAQYLAENPIEDEDFTL